MTCPSSASASGASTGYCGSIVIRVSMITAAAAMRANHLWSAGMTYQGAHSVLVLESISEKAFW